MRSQMEEYHPDKVSLLLHDSGPINLDDQTQSATMCTQTDTIVFANSTQTQSSSDNHYSSHPDTTGDIFKELEKYHMSLEEEIRSIKLMFVELLSECGNPAFSLPVMEQKLD